MKIAIYGAGSWGAALSIALQPNGHQVVLYSPFAEEAEKIAKSRRLMHKLPEIRLPDEVGVSSNLDECLAGAGMVVVAAPSKFIRPVAAELAAFGGPLPLVVNVSKGIEEDTLCTMSEALEDALRGKAGAVAALSGPSHAEEVARGMPTAVVAAHPDAEIAERVRKVFQTPRFRVYTNADRKGVEAGAALKNVIAIAVGISDGLGFGDNARAALIARGLRELGRAGAAMGADPGTFSGLSGLGDLVVTCTSRHSRNRRFGELLAKGYGAAEAEEEIGMAVEGLTTVRAVPGIVKRYGIDMPISMEVRAIALEGGDPAAAVERLMQRESKPELPS